MDNIAKKLIYLLIFAVSIVLIVVGQTNIGVMGLCLMIAGLLGMLYLLYAYNKKYQ